jgi:hypothetical protein
MTKTPKRPRDTNELAKLIVDLATGDATEQESVESDMGKLGRSGGLKGGDARAASMTPERRREIAKAAAEKRWGAKLK